MVGWVVVACALWAAIFIGVMWGHVWMQRNYGWRPLAESVPWATMDLLLGVWMMGCAVAAAAVGLLGYRGLLPGTSRRMRR